MAALLSIGKLAPLPPMPRKSRAGKKGGAKRKRKPKSEDLDRVVQWRSSESGEEGDHTYGTCAKCGRRRPAIELRWSPDRMVFGEWHIGFWSCEDGCDEGRLGK